MAAQRGTYCAAQEQQYRPAGMAGLGVAQKQTERARQVFQRSAEVAGFFEMDRSRLIMPTATGEPSATEEKKEPEKAGDGSGGGGVGDLGLDPLLVALLKKSPTLRRAGLRQLASAGFGPSQ
jgi:hypothetical protein